MPPLKGRVGSGFQADFDAQVDAVEFSGADILCGIRRQRNADCAMWNGRQPFKPASGRDDGDRFWTQGIDCGLQNDDADCRNGKLERGRDCVVEVFPDEAPRKLPVRLAKAEFGKSDDGIRETTDGGQKGHEKGCRSDAMVAPMEGTDKEDIEEDIENGNDREEDQRGRTVSQGPDFRECKIEEGGRENAAEDPIEINGASGEKRIGAFQ